MICKNYPVLLHLVWLVVENNFNLFKVVKLSNGLFNGFMTWVSLDSLFCKRFSVLKCTPHARDLEDTRGERRKY